ncbi:DUF302 domain-containing protein [Onishia taeanensis]|nr:DUF302 domain-containing protein [Halomonas taeanensis]
MAALMLLCLLVPPLSQAAPTGMVVKATPHDFATLVTRLEQAIEDHNMGLVTRASASKGAANRGVTIPGNMVIGVYRNDFAVRMLKASVPAGIEAPIRFYLTENGDGASTLSYRQPSAVFAPYESAELDAMAAELDAIFAAIAEQTVAD